MVGILTQAYQTKNTRVPSTPALVHFPGRGSWCREGEQAEKASSCHPYPISTQRERESFQQKFCLRECFYLGQRMEASMPNGIVKKIEVSLEKSKRKVIG